MADFDIEIYTKAPLQIESSIHFKGKSSKEVFDILANPELIPQWFLLAKTVKMHPPMDDGQTTFNVEFTFFGDVFEEVLEWDMPIRYVYRANGEKFPIKDYIACIEVQEISANEGILRWDIYYSKIEGAHYQKVIPIILPPIIEQSLKELSSLIGGIEVIVTNHFKNNSIV